MGKCFKPKIYKDGKWLTFTIDSGINKDGIWYVL